MLDRLAHTLRDLATWPALLLLLAAIAICLTTFGWRARALGLGEPAFDRRASGYTPAEAGELLDRMGSGGRSLYAATQLTLDLAFPLVYGLFGAILVVWLYPHSWARWVLLVPLLAVALDLSENLITAIMAWRHQQGQTPSLAGLASTLTVAKTWALRLGALALGAGLAIKIVRKIGR